MSEKEPLLTEILRQPNELLIASIKSHNRHNMTEFPLAAQESSVRVNPPLISYLAAE